MTKEDFEINYCNKSNITIETYNEYFVTLPCECNREGCQGWACVSNSPLLIKAHNELCCRKI
jgi:hypothetical protein